MKKIIGYISPLLLACLVPNYAGANEFDNLSIHGFASQGYFYNPDAPYAGADAKQGSFNVREFGLNAAYDINDKTRIAGQVLNRSLGQSVESKTSLDFLLLDQVIDQTDSSVFGVRLGRVKNDFGLYNSIRDIPSARPGIQIPQSVYFDSFRDTFLSVDGMNVYGNKIAEKGLFEWNVFFGKKDIDSKSLEYYALGGLNPGDYEVGDIYGGKLVFEPNDVPGLKLGLSTIKTDVKLEGARSASQSTSLLSSNFGRIGVNPFDGISTQEQAAIGDEIENNLNEYALENENKIHLIMASLQYAFGDFLLSTEYLNIALDSSIVIPSLNGSVEISNTGNVSGFFMQLEWFPALDWSTLIRYEELVLDDDRSIEDLARSFDETHGYQKALTLGAKWDFHQNWSLSGQITINEGTAWIPIYEGMEDDQTTQHWKVYRAALNYQF